MFYVLVSTYNHIVFPLGDQLGHRYACKAQLENAIIILYILTNSIYLEFSSTERVGQVSIFRSHHGDDAMSTPQQASRCRYCWQPHDRSPHIGERRRSHHHRYLSNFDHRWKGASLKTIPNTQSRPLLYRHRRGGSSLRRPRVSQPVQYWSLLPTCMYYMYCLPGTYYVANI